MNERMIDFSPLDAILELEDPNVDMCKPELAFLKALLMDPMDMFINDGELRDLESLLGEVAYVVSCFDLKKMDRYMGLDLCQKLTSTLEPMRDWLYSVERIHEKWPKPSRIYYPRTGQLGFVDHLVKDLEELVKGKAADSVGPLKHIMLQLQEKLQFMSTRLREILEWRKEEELDLKDVTGNIANLAYEVECAIGSFLIREIPIWCCMCWLFSILVELRDVEEQVRMQLDDTKSIVWNVLHNVSLLGPRIIPIFSYSNMSEKLREVFCHRRIEMAFPYRTWCWVGASYEERKRQVFDELLGNVSFDTWRRFPELVAATYLSDYTTEIKLKDTLRELLKYLSYSFLVILEDVPDMRTLSDILKALQPGGGVMILLTTRSLELAIQCRHSSERNLFNSTVEGNTSTSQINKPTSDNNEVVGFNTETNNMLDLLTGGPKDLQIISIVGMAGQGKTTLAKKLYDHSMIISHFDRRTWCFVSQVYNKRELLSKLLNQVVQLSGTIHDQNDEELAAMLYKCLKGHRFLIFLDDMWSKGAWDELARCFPDDKNGSRIMLTTRIQDLASQLSKDKSIIQSISPLSDDESWDLLRKKVHTSTTKTFPSQLLNVGKQIVKNCKGLPLSITLTAGLLAKTEKEVDLWEKIAQTLHSKILGNLEARGKAIIELSYKHLSSDLKPCLLYFGAFLEDREVPVWKLIRLWIAEGFIKCTEGRSLEDVAEDYLKDLIDRSLLTVAREKSIGGVKSCRVHDLIRDFCLAKAREENFWQLVSGGYDKHFLSSTYNQDYGLDPTYSSSSKSIRYQLRRLCIYSKRNHFVTLKPSGPFVRSLLFFAVSDLCPSYTYDVSFISHNFKLLRILDLECINIGDSFKVIEVLVLLRYLAIQGYIDSIPSSIANFWNLQTFLVKVLGSEVVKVSNSIWNMINLRHLHINGSACFNMEPQSLENPCILENLQTFSTPSLAYGDDMEKMMRKLRGIRKLKCIFLDSWDDAKNCNQFPVLEFLHQLVSLKVFYNGKGQYPCEFNFPSSLKKLTLSSFRMPWYQFSQLTKLSKLEALKLLDSAFEGETWVMEPEEVMEKLKFLKLDTLNVVEWIAFQENFPKLEHIVLHKCGQLLEIPSDVGNIDTLQRIEVMWCTPDAATSAKNIREEQLEYAKEILVHTQVEDYE